MGDKKLEKKSTIDLLNESIKAIETRKGYLQTKLVYETDDKSKAKINEELRSLEQQLSYTVDTKKNVEVELERIKKDEERKRVEELLKATYYIGLMRQNAHNSMDMDKRFDKDKQVYHEAKAAKEEELAKQIIIDNIFNTMELQFVTRDMIDEIIEDEEFHEMASEDPNRLERKEENLKNDLENRIDEKLGATADNNLLDETYEEKKRRYTVILSKKNGYKKAYDFLSAVDANRERIGDPEINESILELKKELKSLSDQVHKLYNNTDQFTIGNGFTQELIDKEKAVFTMIEEQANNILMKAAALGEEGAELKKKGDLSNFNIIPGKEPEYKKEQDCFKIYEALQLLKPSVVDQMKDDNDSFRTNELMKRTEMWKVYQKLQEKGLALTPQEKNKVIDDEFKSLEKIQQIQKSSSGLALDNLVAGWVAEDLLRAFNMVKNVRDDEKNKDIPNNKKHKLNENNKAMIKTALAKLVINQILTYESINRNHYSGGYYEELSKFREKTYKNDKTYSKLKTKLASMAQELEEDPEFKKMYNKCIKSKNYTTNVIRFIADGTEKTFAKHFMKRNAAKKSQEKAEADKELQKKLEIKNKNIKK